MLLNDKIETQGKDVKLLEIASSRAIIIAVFSFGVWRCAAEDFRTWDGVSIKTLDTEYVDLVSSAELRLNNDSSTLHQYKLTESIVIKTCRNLDLGVNYTYIPTRSAANGDFLYQHRLELEVVPIWPVTDRLTLDFRQRLELRWHENQNGVSELSRHRVQAAYSLTGLGCLTSVFASDEMFYDYGRNAFSVNRVIPLGLHFQLREKVGIDVYYMFHSAKTAGGWQNSSILGTQLSLAF